MIQSVSMENFFLSSLPYPPITLPMVQIYGENLYPILIVINLIFIFLSSFHTNHIKERYKFYSNTTPSSNIFN